MFKIGDVVQWEAKSVHPDWPREKVARVTDVAGVHIRLNGEWWISHYFELVPSEPKPSILDPIQNLATGETLLLPEAVEMQRLQKENAELKAANAALTASLNRIDKPTDNAVPGSLESYIAQEKFLRDKLDEAKAEIDHWRVDYKVLSEERAELLKAHDSTLNALTKAKARIVDVEKAADVIVSDNQRLRASTPHDYDLLKKQVGEYEAEIERLTNRCAAAEMAGDALEVSLREANATIEKYKHERVTCANCYETFESLTACNEHMKAKHGAGVVPRNEIAWLIGWLERMLSVKETYSTHVSKRVEIVDAWLGGAK